MKKVLITGGCGFIGGFLAAALAERGATVHLVDNMARGRCDSFLNALLARPGVELHKLDLLADGTLDTLDTNYDAVFHLAAILGVQNVLERPYPTLRDNVRMLDGMLGFGLRQTRLRRFVFTSTSEVYAGSLEHMEMPIPTPEGAPLALPGLDRPRTSYMLSKIYGEAMVQHSGLPFTIIRPHNVYGPRMGQSHVVPQLLQKAHSAPAGSSIVVYSVDHTRTFCYIDDAIDMLIASAQSERCSGEVLNLGAEQPETTIETLARIVIKVVGKLLTIVPRPATPGSPTRRCPRMIRMTELAGVTAQIGLEEGVRRTYDWYRPIVFEGAETEVAN